MREAYIYDAIRSPRTRAKDSGGLHELTPHELLKQLYETLRERTGLDPADISFVDSPALGTILDDELCPGADLLVTSCPACMIQLSYGIRRHKLKTKVCHISQVVAGLDR